MVVMWNATEKLFGSRIRAKLLGWFFTHTDESFFVRQLASILKEDPTNLSREMTNLENLGILKSARKGNLKLFQAKQDCPFFMEMKGLVLKTAGVVGQIKEILRNGAGIEYAFIYGSYAYGKEQAGSDVDLMIIGNVDMDSLDKSISDLEKGIGRSINYVLYSRDEFKSKCKAKDGFLRDVLAGDKIVVAGKKDGLEAT